MSYLAKHNEQLLLFLALDSGLHGIVLTSTAKIAKQFGVSQQTASRKLRNLKKAGLISLNASPSGCEISITSAGASVLRKNFLSLKRLFGGKQKPSISGKVKTGLGEGRYYISRPVYLKQFKTKLGFNPFLGTLNLRVSNNILEQFLLALQPIEIAGFKTDERSFGKILVFKVLVEGKQQAAIIFPERTAHARDEIEIIAPINLRKKFKLKEGSKVSVFS